MKNPHALVIPFPAQGHVIPLMELSQCLAERGFEITFVNTEFNHKRVMASLPKNVNKESQIHLVSIPDGMKPGEDKNNIVKLCDSILTVMPGYLEKLIRETNESDDSKITCIIADETMGWTVKVAKKMEISTAVFWTCAVGIRTMILHIPQLIEAGILHSDGKDMSSTSDISVSLIYEPKMSFQSCNAVYFQNFLYPLFTNELHPILTNEMPHKFPKRLDELFSNILAGTPVKQQIIHLSPTMPAMNTDHLLWNCFVDKNVQRSIFRQIVSNFQDLKDVDWYLCSSVYELEKSAFLLNPNLLPVGPLLADSQPGQLTANFWTEDSTCLNWLDQQSANSVIYVAFGSFTVFDKLQFHELALGLENAGRPFLWVVRPDLTDGSSDAYPDGFQERVASQGRMVGWAPQQKVLAHPSIACFLTHCGWNSTMEGVTMGVPFLCWPYFADQFLNQSYICDVWKVGLQLTRDDNGFILKSEITNKVQALFVDETIRARTLELKEIVNKSVSEGGSSRKSLNDFIESLKAK